MLAPRGASHTGVTWIDIVWALAAGSRLTPPLATPPSSCTWNLKLSYAGVRPLPFGAGVNVNRPALIAETGTGVPAVIGVPLNLSVPLLVLVVIRTLWKALGPLPTPVP